MISITAAAITPDWVRAHERKVARDWIAHCGGDLPEAIARLRSKLATTTAPENLDRNIEIWKLLSVVGAWSRCHDVGVAFGITGSMAQQINTKITRTIRDLLRGPLPKPARRLEVQHRPVKPFRLPWAVVDFTSHIGGSYNVVGRFKSEADARLFVEAVANAEGAK
jgi:hypothetical protein